eukprot:TRINITY_DN7697_c0_g1_i3.p1 TRINITY_DN7697_c0_g1~~TRINITY_DN7697_c0_g1_i3.p1  ORF type:complete len:376 (+),score=104.66 TRINITY_DN7697_c0_g1_i3:1055-2182(+)
MSRPGLRSTDVGQATVGEDGRKIYTIHGNKFEVPSKFNLTKAVGFGAYGFVCAAVNTETGEKVAIKKCQDVFHEVEDGKRVLREIRLLSFLNHENLLTITDLLPPIDKNFSDVYIVTPLMDTDMNNVLKSRQQLDDNHYQYFIYQVLRGLKFIHSAQVLHRDLKPANLLTNISCDLRICDFGLARGFNADDLMTEYVVTRWYRPPELLLMCQQYSPAVDIWSAGCIFAEMLNRKPLFPGKDHLTQLGIICDALGKPSDEDLAWLSSPEALRYLKRLPPTKPKPISALVPKLQDPVAQEFLSKMLVFNPEKRWSAERLLAHPYLAHLHDVADEPVSKDIFQWEYEEVQGMKAIDLRRAFWKEFCRFHPKLREKPAP